MSKQDFQLELSDAELLDYVINDYTDRYQADDLEDGDRYQAVNDLGLRLGAWLHDNEKRRA